MVESRQDKTNPCGRLILTSEGLIFQAMKRYLQVEGNPYSLGSSRFSWDNFRLDGQRILAQLDRFYVFTNSCSASGRKLLSYTVKKDYGWSYHRPVELVIQLVTRSHQISRWKMSSFYLAKAKEEIAHIWKAKVANTPFFRKIKVVTHFYKRPNRIEQPKPPLGHSSYMLRGIWMTHLTTPQSNSSKANSKSSSKLTRQERLLVNASCHSFGGISKVIGSPNSSSTR